MMTKKKLSQAKVYEFLPDESITIKEIIELSELVRVGVSGHVLDNATEGLKKHFVEVSK